MFIVKQDDDFKEMLQSSAKMESTYAPFIDIVLINDDLEQTVGDLCQIITNMDFKPQWVNAAWVR